MSTQQALVQLAHDNGEDLPTTKYAVLPEENEVVVIERVPGATRAVPALEVSLTIALVSESNFYVGFAEDLSDGGIFVATSSFECGCAFSVAPSSFSLRPLPYTQAVSKKVQPSSIAR